MINRRLLSIGILAILFLVACQPEAVPQNDAPPPDPPVEAEPVDDVLADEDLEWTTHEPLPEQRTEVSVTTDGERIYLAGGFGPPETDERATAPRTLWAYTPGEDSWEALTDIPEGVHHTAFVYHEGRLFILGGFRETGFTPVDNVRVYDLQTAQWSEGAPMPTARGAAGFTVLDGRIHIIGGNAESPEAVEGMAGVEILGDRSVNVHEAYDPQTDRWTELAPMPTPRNHLGAAAFEDQIHAVLGRAEGDFRFTTHEIYDAATDSWEEGPPVPTGRSGVAVLRHGDYIYTFGGEDLAEDNRRTFAEAERYDPIGDHWQQLPDMPTARHGLGAASFGDGIYVISGGPGPAFTFGDANERLAAGPPVIAPPSDEE